MIKTDNFNSISDPKLLCTCGHAECDRRSVSQDTLDALQRVRDDYGMPMIITSGGRCINHPYQVCKDDPNGGDHPRGDGVDIEVLSRTDFNRLAVIAGRHGFNAIGDGFKRRFIHLGRRAKNGNRVSSWGY